ncbi:MAG: hypothetical protein RIM84_11840 [Alphaproteobacteria bacterium]
MTGLFDRFKSKPKAEVAAERRRVVEVGWLLQTQKAGFIWDAPRQFQRNDPPAQHAKSVQMCPAVIDFEARTYEVPCPLDVHLRFKYDEQGAPQLVNAAGQQSAIRNRHLREMTAIVARAEWRHPDRPVIQIITPYTFLADEPVWMNQLPPYLAYRDPPLPGVLIGGRLPIHIWPRQMMWAFEWHDTSKDLILRRGEPWFYCRFELEDPTRQIRMVEAEVTDELREYFEGMAAVTNYVKRTFSLFDVAQERRPAKLLVKKER